MSSIETESERIDREHDRAQAFWTNARYRLFTATSRRLKREAAEDVEFWGNKMAYWSTARASL